MNNSNPSPLRRPFVSIAAVLAAAMATASLGPVPASAAAAVLPGRRSQTVRRSLEGEDGHEDHDHGGAGIFAEEGDDHDDHDGHDHGDDSHDGHDHGDDGRAYEWAGSFALDDERHAWSMQKVGGAYADPSMKVVLIATSSPGEETQEAFEDMAEALMEGECAIVEDGGTMTVSAIGTCFQLKVNDGAMDSKFDIDTAGIAGVAVFAEHFPTEFERDQHYLKDSSGMDIEPLGDHDGHDHGDHDGHDHGEFASSANAADEGALPWGPVIGASILVNLATLSGVVVVAMAFVQRGLLRSRGEDASGVEMGRGMVFDICIPAFAVGALISTAVFLIFPEALHLIEGAHADHGEEGGGSHDGHDHRFLQEDSHDGHDHGDEGDSEGSNAAKFGCAIIGGFLIPMVLAIFFPHVDVDGDAGRDSHQGDAETGVVVTASARDLTEENAEEAREEEQAMKPEEASASAAAKNTINKHLCSSILLGDGFHNFGDGIFIGAAFKSCSTGTALSITFATLFHEIAQELADFVVLTRYAGLSVVMACVLNFLSGLTVLLGGVVFLAANPTDEATGVVLAMAGGVYFYIAGCETVPRIEKSVTGRADRVWTLVSVIVGTIPIGLILLNHEHC